MRHAGTETWRTVALRWLTQMQSGEAITSEDIEAEGAFPVYGGNGLRGYSSRCTHSGEYLLIGRQGAHCGNVHRVTGSFWASEHAVVTKVLGESDSKWFAYLLGAMNLNQYSVAAAQPGLAVDRIRALGVRVPPAGRQRTIAAFLDRKAAAIDALIAKKERLVESLQEKRQALITQAVTKGLDPTAAMKESGLPWLGKVPVHWDVKKLRRISKRVDVGIAEAATHAYAETGIPIIRSTNVANSRFAAEDLLYVAPWFAEKNRTKYLWADDLVTVRTGNAGVTAVVPAHLDRSQCFTLLITTLHREHVPEFFCYVLNCEAGRSYFAMESWGTAQRNISVPILGDMKIAVPPAREQGDIVKWLAQQVPHVDRMLSITEMQIDCLREYRQALITAAVTGQIDVSSDSIHDDVPLPPPTPSPAP